MTNQDALCQRLQSLWYSDFPLTRAIGIEVLAFEDHVITTRSSLAPNTNTHGTAFAGSLYAIEALTAWGLLYLELVQANLDASIIHASGNIEFAKPVQQDIVATASFADHIPSIEGLRKTGKLRLSLNSQVYAADELASSFSGVFVARLNP